MGELVRRWVIGTNGPEFVDQENLPAAASQLAKIHPLMILNFALGWLAVGAVVIWR